MYHIKYLIFNLTPSLPTLGAQDSRLSPANKTQESTDKQQHENKTKNKTKKSKKRCMLPVSGGKDSTQTNRTNMKKIGRKERVKIFNSRGVADIF